MGAAKKRDRRAANYQERQRREAAAAKAEKERQSRDGDVDLSQYAMGGTVQYTLSPGTWVIPAGVHLFGSGNTWMASGANGPTTKVDLPKSESTDLIVGYRMWPLSRSYPDGYRLNALNTDFATFEPNQKLEAACKRNHFEHGPVAEHVAPQADCTCGIHAYSHSVPLDIHSDGKPFVCGEVNLWGKVIVHDDGYRAQFAYPKKLVLVDGGARASKIADSLELAYGVPCEVWD